MANGCHRPCPGCRIRSLCWPLVLIAAGVLFSLDFIWRLWPIGKTWPILLILWGLCGMASRLAPDTGHGTPPSPSSAGV